MMSTWPDFVIEQAHRDIQAQDIDEKYKNRLLQIIEEAKKCKMDLGLNNDPMETTN